MVSIINFFAQFAVTDIEDVKQIISCESVQLSSLSQEVLSTDAKLISWPDGIAGTGGGK